MRVLLVSPAPRDVRPDTDLAPTVARILGALEGLPRCETVHERIETLADLERAVRLLRPDAVFNACETLGGRSAGEPLVPRLLDRLGVPFTGSPARCLSRCLRKARASAVLEAAGVPVPATFAGAVPDSAYPVIVKPEREDGSVGIDASSVVYDDDGRRLLLSALAARGQRAIVQQYVEGREIAVALLGWPEPRVLSPGEIIYDAEAFAGRARILTYASKWDPSSIDHGATRSTSALLAPGLLDYVSAIARRAARVLGMRDYGRVDLRIDPGGRAYLIDANPNCDLSSDGGFMRAARRSHLGYTETIAAILAGAVARGNDSSSRRAAGRA